MKAAVECVNKNADYNASETIFNMINGMFGLMYLAENVQVFDLSKYVSGDASAKSVYPQSVDTEFSYSNGKLAVKLDDVYGARLFEITNN